MLLCFAVQVKLIDLGMAGVYQPSKPQRGCMGSPGFIAPEVIRGCAHKVPMGWERSRQTALGTGQVHFRRLDVEPVPYGRKVHQEHLYVC
jgi:serine/threonine protein kinase